MLYAVKPQSRKITAAARENGALVLCSDYMKIFITPLSKRAIRVTATKEADISAAERAGTLKTEPYCGWEYSEAEGEITLKSGDIILSVDRATGSFKWYDKERRPLLKETDKESVTLEKFTKYKLAEARTQRVKTADGEKEVISEASRIEDGYSYHATVRYVFQDGEALYGLGQHEEGYGNLRGKMVYGHQANRKISLPMLISNLGWGILSETYSPFIFGDCGMDSYIYSEAVPELSYIFINGGDMRGTVSEYRSLTGAAAMLPRWAYGYIQSQERYETQDEILKIASEYRNRGIGLDCVVLDWCSWEDGKWGQKSFDKKRFPDPSGMTEKLHSEHTHFMISVWPNADPGCENYDEFKEKGMFLPGQNVYNAFSPDARKTYWNQLEKGLYCHGVDAWWCDNSEPITPEWQKIERPEPSRMYSEYVSVTSDHMPPELSNAFGLYHALGVYDGQRGYDKNKRVCNLTRSGYIGSQRLGTILWSGDIAATWDTLSRQIGAGLNFCASGIPYWTTDTGAFFVKNGPNWYWRGDFDGTVNDLGYRELFTRWYQWSAFLPIFRGHGTDCRRELWLYENADGVNFYDAIVKANKLRYSLMPYIYSTAGKCSVNGGSMIENLAFTWPDDPEVLNITDQYMFGESIMVCPVHEPMYYFPGSEKADRPKTRRVYFPKTPGGWYDYETREHYAECWAEIECPIDKIPIFVRAGAVIPTVSPALSTEELGDKLDIKVFPGADGRYVLYEDSGDGYGYEKGEYRLTEFKWDDNAKTVTRTVIKDSPELNSGYSDSFDISLK